MSAPKRLRARSQRPSHIYCRTCRARKIKCSKERPLCRQCVQANRKCEGYDSWEVVVRDSNDRKSPTTPGKPTNETTITASPSGKMSDVRVTDEMRHAFNHFRYNNYVKYGQRGYPTLWASYAISICLTEPAVFYGLASLGALEASVPAAFHTSLARPLNAEKLRIALKMYTAAIAHLQEAIPQASRKEGSLDPVIFSCLLFLIFEHTRGNWLSAMRHARTGNSILNERLGLLQSPPRSPFGSTGTASQKSPASSVRMVDIPELVPPSHSQPLEFTSLEHARDHLEACAEAGQEIQAELLRFAEAFVQKLVPGSNMPPAARFCLAITLSKVIPLPSSSKLDERVEDMKLSFKQWKSAFAQLLASKGISFQKTLKLQVRYFCASLPIFGCRALSEQWTDALYGDFVTTMEAIERLLHQQRDMPIAESLMQRLDLVQGNRRGNAMLFTEEPTPEMISGPESLSATLLPHAVGVFEIGILQALSQIACKCRNASLRRKAATTLSRIHWFQTVDSSQQLARFTKAVIGLEEQGMHEHFDGFSPTLLRQETSDPPGQTRFTDVVASLTDSEDTILLSCTQRESDGQIILKEYRCSNLGNRSGEPAFEEIWTWRPSLNFS